MINRIRTIGEFTEGQLSIDGVRICSTLENSNAQVPSGEYQLSLLKCKQYSRKMPLLDLSGSLKSGQKFEKSEKYLSNRPQADSNLSNRCLQCKRLPFACNNSTLPCWCPMLKPGNGIHNRLDGSILVGQYNSLGSLVHPKTTFDPLYERIRKSISRGNEVTVTIKDVPSTLSPHPSTKIFV